MPKKLHKSLQDYLSKIKKPSPIHFPSSNTFSSSKSWILAGCKHPKTLSFAIDRHQVQIPKNQEAAAAARLSDVDRFLLENFRSLYLKDDEDLNEKRSKTRIAENLGDVSPESQTESGSRLFFSSPGSPESLLNDSQSETSQNGRSSSSSFNREERGKNVKLSDDCIAILRYSPSPCEEFQRSMQEMMDNRLRNNEEVDWEFMEELLFSFLNLNDKKSYKFILNAFVDLVVILRQKSDEAPEKSRQVRSVRRVRKMMI